MRYQINIDGQETPVEINPAQLDWDMLKKNNGEFHILRENKSYNAVVLHADSVEKTYTIKINNNVYTLHLKDETDMLIQSLGMESATKSKLSDIKAPMPGLVLQVNVQPGDQVKKGDIVMILEAMKMENAIKAPADATVKSVLVNKGTAVDKNQVLIDFA